MLLSFGDIGIASFAVELHSTAVCMVVHGYAAPVAGWRQQVVESFRKAQRGCCAIGDSHGGKAEQKQCSHVVVSALLKWLGC